MITPVEMAPMFNGFFDPFFMVASWFVGIFGGILFGLFVICATVAACVLVVFVAVWAFISILDLYSSFTLRRAQRRLQKRINARQSS